jgi:hypothetical protein
MRTFVLLLCLLFTLSCVKHAAPPPPAAAAPPVLPQFERLNALHENFLGFRDDPLFVRYGFTFNSPHADWLQEVQRLERDPDLAEGARVLAGLAVAHRQYGAGSVVTRQYETRFARIVRDLPDEPPVPAGQAVAVSPDVVVDAPESESASQAPAVEEEVFAQPALPSVASSVPVTDAPAAPAAEEGFAQPALPAVASTAPDSDTSAVVSAPAAPVVESAGSADGAATPGQPPAIAADAPAPAVQSLPAASTVAEGARSGVTILFSGDTQGVIFPQPGVAGPVGGIARRPSLIGRVRAEDPGVVLVDAGDAFTSGFGRAGRINNVLVRAMNRMGYDAMGLGPYDLAVGEVALRELVSIAEFPFVCSNLVFQGGVKAWINPYVILQRGPFRIGIISLLPPDAVAAFTGARLVPPAIALRGVLAELGPKVDGVVLLTQIGSAEIAEILDGLAVSVVAGDGKVSSREEPLYLPAVPKGLGFVRVRLEPAEGAALRPAEHGPVLLGEQQDGRLLRLLEELRN